MGKATDSIEGGTVLVMVAFVLDVAETRQKIHWFGHFLFLKIEKKLIFGAILEVKQFMKDSEIK